MLNIQWKAKKTDRTLWPIFSKFRHFSKWKIKKYPGGYQICVSLYTNWWKSACWTGKYAASPQRHNESSSRVVDQCLWPVSGWDGRLNDFIVSIIDLNWACCRVRKGTGSQVHVISNKEARAGIICALGCADWGVLGTDTCGCMLITMGDHVEKDNPSAKSIPSFIEQRQNTHKEVKACFDPEADLWSSGTRTSRASTRRRTAASRGCGCWSGVPGWMAPASGASRLCLIPELKLKAHIAG